MMESGGGIWRSGRVLVLVTEKYLGTYIDRERMTEFRFW